MDVRVEHDGGLIIDRIQCFLGSQASPHRHRVAIRQRDHRPRTPRGFFAHFGMSFPPGENQLFWARLLLLILSQALITLSVGLVSWSEALKGKWWSVRIVQSIAG